MSPPLSTFPKLPPTLVLRVNSVLWVSSLNPHISLQHRPWVALEMIFNVYSPAPECFLLAISPISVSPESQRGGPRQTSVKWRWGNRAMFLETVLLSKCLCVLERCFPPFLSSILLISFSLGLPATQGFFLFLRLRDILSFYFVWLSMSVYMN